jgi:uncharacterized membrane protein (UPF0127 family)
MMTRIVAVLFTIGVLGAGAARPAVASARLQNALPPHARLLASTVVPGRPGEYALTYQTSEAYLAIVVTRGNRARLLWFRKLPAVPSSLDVPGPAGLFQVTAKDAAFAGEWLFAFNLRADRVASAIDGRPSGSIYGDERISVRPTGFSILSRDLKHQGSVRYRTVTRYIWNNGLYRRLATVHVPDYAPDAYPRPNGTIHARSGDIVLVRLEIAATPQQQETGLMYRKALDPDSGMIFVWDQPVQDSFWMENTYIPLTVAFLDANGRMMETQDMQPLTTAGHMPKAPYMYALEVNQGFFAAHGVEVGDQIQLHLDTP